MHFKSLLDLLIQNSEGNIRAKENAQTFAISVRNKKRKGRASTEPAAAACSAPSPSTPWSVAASALVSQHLPCSSFLQMPYLLLNPSLPEVRPRMYPVFFGESIEVSPEPVQEIRYRWVWVGWRGFLSFSRCSSFCKKLKCVYKWDSQLWEGRDKREGNP